jgi:hypothetical protein
MNKEREGVKHELVLDGFKTGSVHIKVIFRRVRLTVVAVEKQ